MLLAGPTWIKRRRARGRIGRNSSASSEETAFGYWGASASESRTISLHRSARSHLGELRVAAGSRSCPVLGEFRHQYGGRAYARSSEQEGAREAARGHKKVSPGQHRPRHSSAANAELWSTGKLIRTIGRSDALQDLIQHWKHAEIEADRVRISSLWRLIGCNCGWIIASKRWRRAFVIGARCQETSMRAGWHRSFGLDESKVHSVGEEYRSHGIRRELERWIIYFGDFILRFLLNNLLPKNCFYFYMILQKYDLLRCLCWTVYFFF